MISLRHFYLNKDDKFILDIPDLQIDPGARLFIVGPSGSGKTTLLKRLVALDYTKNGELYVDQNHIKHDDMPSVKNASMMLMTQELGLWPHLSVQEHLSFANSKGVSLKENVDEWLNLVQLNTHANKRPHELSGGQRQRLALARALASKPNYLFLDEPFASIDPVLAAELMTMIDKQQMKQGFTLIKTTHHYLGIKDEKTEILVINEGKISQRGSWMGIKEDPKDEWTRQWVGLLS